MLSEAAQSALKGFKVIAHRGLSSLFPENTKEAIIAGLHCSDFSEFDIHLTKDNHVVVFHDRTLSRITDVKIRPEYFGLKK